jgi:hypothetical protein
VGLVDLGGGATCPRVRVQLWSMADVGDADSFHPGLPNGLSLFNKLAIANSKTLLSLM